MTYNNNDDIPFECPGRAAPDPTPMENLTKEQIEYHRKRLEEIHKRMKELGLDW